MKTSFVISVLFFVLAGNAYSQADDIILFGKVTACKTKKPVPDAVITIIGTDGTHIELKADKKGKYFATKAQLKEGASFVISCGHLPDFLIKTGKFTLYPKYPPTAIERDFELDPSSTCEGMGPPILCFDKDSWKIKGDNKISLNNLLETLKENPTIVIEISGHADFREELPQNLSEKRAEAIKGYLVKRGIEKDRLAAIGYGSAKPYVIYHYNDIFKNGDILDQGFVSKLKDPNAIAESIKLNGAAEFKVLRYDYETSK